MNRQLSITTLSLFVAVAQAAGETKTIVGADRDTAIRFVPEDYGNRGTNVVMVVGENAAQQLFRTLIAFDLSVIPTGAEVSEATLLIRQTATGGVATNSSGMNIGAYRLLQEWTAADVTSTRRTQSNTWSKPGADDIGVDRSEKVTAVANNVANRGTVPDFRSHIAWEVTEDVRDFVAGKSPNYGWILIAETEPAGGPMGTVSLNSTEKGKEYAPALRVTFSTP